MFVCRVPLYSSVRIVLFSPLKRSAFWSFASGIVLLNTALLSLPDVAGEGSYRS